MRIAGISIGIGPRRLTGIVGAALGLVVMAAATWLLGVEWGLLLLAGLLLLTILAIGLVYTAIGRIRVRQEQARTETEELRSQLTRVEEAAAAAPRAERDIQEMREALRALANQIDSRLAVAEQAHRLTRADAVWLNAQRTGRELGGPHEDREREIELIRASGFFDAQWYRQRLGSDTPDPVAHYVDHAGSVRSDPHPLFDSTWYLEQHPRALARWHTPLAHFLSSSRQRHLDPHPAFWSQWYADRYLGTAAEPGTLPVTHFLTTGAAAGNDPNPLFQVRWYQEQYGDQIRAGTNPLIHYLTEGATAGLDPSPLFDTKDARQRLGEFANDPLSAFLDAERDPAGVLRSPSVRREPEAAKVADLRWEYLVRGLHHEPDTFVLYRIIGNDLPPRHRAGQGVENLRFILEHEPDLPGCEKRWVVNRIADPDIERQLIALLEESGREYLHIPFDREEYRKVGWHFDRLEPPGLTYRWEMEEVSANNQRRILDHVYHYKNLYVMNNNGARNAALRDGRGRAKWVLPWDGNCFLTAEAWDDLVRAVTSEPHLKYFIVPMARVLDNQLLLRPGARPRDATEEPQLLFRRDAAEEFNPNARYGRRPKIDLFYRLGVPGVWDEWPDLPWDPPRPRPGPEAGHFGTAGWVARLFSGERHLEVDIVDRGWRRMAAIRECIDRLDEATAAETFDPAALFVLDEATLHSQRERYRDGEPGPKNVVADLVERAERSLDASVYSVVTHSHDRGVQQSMIDEAMRCALAGYFTDEGRFLNRGAQLLRAWFLSPDTRTRARRRPAEVGRGRSQDQSHAPAIIDTSAFHYLLDAIRLIERAEALTAPEAAELRDWFSEHRAWLVESPQGGDERAALDHHGTWYDVQLAAIDAFLGDLRGLLGTSRRAYERVGQQFQPDGRAPEELVRTQTQHYSAYNLQGWVVLASCLGRVGQDLWGYRTPDGRGLAPAAHWLLRRIGMPWEYPQQDAFDADRLVALAHQVAAKTTTVPALDFVGEDQRDPWRVKQVFTEHDGIRPFWVLGG